ncbi:MAG TPA: DUF2079 domain-containing protein [Actinomycetes bacterium]
MVTRLQVGGSPGSEPDPTPDRWLPAADLPLGGGRTAGVAFDRGGRARLRLVLDQPASDADVALLEEAAEVLPHLRLADLDAGSDYPLRHARHFGLERALGPGAFNRAAEVELVAPGGRRLPSTLGACGLPARTVRSGPAPAAERPQRPAGGTGGLEEQGGRPPVDGAGPPPDGGLVERLLLVAGRRLVATTRLSAWTLCGIALGITLAVFVLGSLYQTWTLHQRFGTYGYDVGIYDQGTWLLSRLHRPFSTIRGLPLFGDHASYVLLLVAPLYRIWADPRLLLTIQVLFLALPAVVVYRLGARRLGHPAAGLAVAVAYLAYPAMQWAIVWQFHPETIAAGALAMAALAADRDQPRATYAWLAVALACREDVGLVVAGFGALLAVSGKRELGRRIALLGLGYFLVVTFLLIPLANGRPTAQFEATYRIGGHGPLAVLLGLPWIVLHAATTAISNDGLFYLLLVFLPLAGLPLLAPRWLLPVAAPLLLNLASAHPEQHQIRFHYLATAAPFLALAAIAGLEVVAARRRALLAPLLVLMVLLAFMVDQRTGPTLWSKDKVLPAASAVDASRDAALATVAPGEPVSAQFHLVAHLTHRTRAYEFPNPFRAVNWGLSGDGHSGAEVDAVRWVVVEPALLGQDDRNLLQRLQQNGQWRVAYDQGGVEVLQRTVEPAP